MVAPTSDNGQTRAGPGDDASQLLDGEELLAAIAAAAEHLRETAPVVDAINVYPVPDGDTGSNMAATLREGVDTAAVTTPRTAQAILDGLARGSLYGARGNSGVILSQALAGLAGAAGDFPEGLDAASLAAGLERAASAAYRAVSEPVEGTMLTVLRAAAEAATNAARGLPGAGHGRSCLPVLRAALEAAEAAEARTIDQLPKLREAGVPDAGGEGVCVILRGLVAALTGERPAAPQIPDRPIAMLAGHGDEQFGFCTEFLLEPKDGVLDVEAVRAWAESGTNRSVVVVGTPDVLRIHLHADDGRLVLDEAGRFGSVSRAKVEDMAAQHGRFRESGTGAGALVALLAVAHGDGLRAMFESLGAATLDPGSGGRPSAGAIAAAADGLGSADVVVLPNHKDVVLAAQQAAGLARCTLHVADVTNIPQGLAAALAFAGTEPAGENLRRMSEAARAVTCVEVTHATSVRTVEGVSVRAGQAIALIDGRLRLARDTAVDALIDGLREAEAETPALVSVFGGADVAPGALEAACERLCAALPDVEVEVHEGGQAIYAFIASVER